MQVGLFRTLGSIQRELMMLRGSCLCGKICYEIHGSAEIMYYCHCGTCRKASGSSFATNILVLVADFVITSGQVLLKAFESSAGEWRHFCSECGSPIYSKTNEWPEKISIRCGSLDTDPIVRLTEHIYTGSKAPWIEICDGLPQLTEESEH